MRSKIIFLFLFLAFSFFGFSCHKNKVQEQLPPETQTGANTFGCLVNGTAFIPKSSGIGGSPALVSYYQFTYNSITQGFVFQVAANRKGNNCELTSIAIGGDSIKINEGETYNFLADTTGNFVAKYTYFPSCVVSEIDYVTKNNFTGQLVIKKFDQIHQIVSGTFWFDAVDTVSNTSVQIREGRFDLHYTQ